VQESVHGTTQCKPKGDTHKGPIGYFLYNSDYTNVMQELNASASNFIQNRGNVSYFVAAFSPLALPVLPVPDNKKSGLQTTSAASAGSVPNDAAQATQSNDVPSCSDSDITISNYLDCAFPSYSIVNTTADTFDPCLSLFTEYDKYPTFNTSYRSVTKKEVGYKSTSPDWEPYARFFSQIRWSEESNSDHNYTFCELAIAAHILTGGATSPSQDLCTKINCMKLAFKKYFQSQK
jgi:hypothetical protein